jgi:gliding motility-associated-like protein
MRFVKFLCFIILIFGVFNAYAQTSTYCPPPNIGFETGNFTGWQCDTGGVAANGLIQVIPSTPIPNRQVICSDTTTPALDPYGNFPKLCPYGGNYSLKLGNDLDGARAERVAYTFTVPNDAATYDITFYYAVVLQNPQHYAYQQPRFTVNTFDLTDSNDTTDSYQGTQLVSPTQVSCSSFDFVAAANLPGFHISKLAPKNDSVFYKDWAPADIHLTGYAGKKIRIEFTANDCTLGGHFGYAYVDVNEACGSPVTGSTYCSGQKSVTLLAPGGFGEYKWFTSDFSKQLGTGQGLTISPPPPDGTKYAVQVIPANGFGCVDTIYTSVTSINSGFIFKVQDTVYSCQGTSVDLTAQYVTAGSSSGLTYSYFRDSLGTQYLYAPQKIDTSGLYYIRAQNAEGCTNILPVDVIIGNPPINVTDPPEVAYPATVNLATAITHYSNLTYAYYSNAALTDPVINYQYVSQSGTYYIKITNPISNCSSVAPVHVKIGPPPPPVVKAVNTFTPNGDGINDYFSVSIVGFAEFKSLKVFNRYGQLVFQTTSQNVPWDGTVNGKPLSEGTYYWLFEGTNIYYGTKISQGGSITLLR